MFGSAPQALAGAAMDFVRTAVTGLDGSACGELLIALGGVQAKLSAVPATVLRRFDAADAHDADGYGSTSAWLAAKAQLTRKDARAAVREMRRLGERPHLDAALAAGDITRSWALAIADWTRKLPAPMRDQTDRILLWPRPPERHSTTSPPAPPARSRPGAPSSPTPPTATSSSAPRSAAPG